MSVFFSPNPSQDIYIRARSLWNFYSFPEILILDPKSDVFCVIFLISDSLSTLLKQHSVFCDVPFSKRLRTGSRSLRLRFPEPPAKVLGFRWGGPGSPPFKWAISISWVSFRRNYYLGPFSFPKPVPRYRSRLEVYKTSIIFPKSWSSTQKVSFFIVFFDVRFLINPP